VKGETIAAIGIGLGAGAREIDATGKLVLPGGIDTHTHIEQVSAGGLLNADTFESATTSAAFGGNTTVVSFAAQHRGSTCARSSTTTRLAKRGALIDYAFHMIVANPDEKTIRPTCPR
jgi:dihydropyrimidinase